jgi:hypothetical protein
MKTFPFIAAACLIATAAFAQDLSWGELARRPELWPAQCAAKETMKFDGGVTVQAGQKLNVLKVTAGEVQLSTIDGRTTFTAEPDETNLLVVAREAYAKLTPKQRALTYDSIVQRKDLWPSQVALNKSFDLGGGRSLREGEQLRVLEVQPGKVILLAEKFNLRIPTLPQVTDLMAQARRFVEDESAGPRFAVEQQRAEEKRMAEQKVAEEKRGEEQKLAAESDRERKRAEENRRALGRVIAEMDGKLVSSITGKPAPLDPESLPRYLVFYRGSSTCPITREFTPTLIKYYQAMKPKHPEFELIYIMTESVEDTSKFAKQIGFSWRALEYGSTGSIPSVSQPIQGLLPQLIVMDRSGRVLANGWQNSAPAALKQLDALLRTSAARP